LVLLRDVVLLQCSLRVLLLLFVLLGWLLLPGWGWFVLMWRHGLHPLLLLLLLLLVLVLLL
jgi:hypothetical protein